MLWLGQRAERSDGRFSRALEGWCARSNRGQATERGRYAERSLSAIETTKIEQAGDPARFLTTMGRVAKKRKASKASLKARRRVALDGFFALIESAGIAERVSQLADK